MIPSTTQEAIRHIHRLQIQTTRKVNDLFAGAYHSAFKGQGLEFEEVREYQQGDEMRNVDWNVTARMFHPFVKTFREERALTVILIVDISASSHFGHASRLKNEVIAEIAAIIAFSAMKNQDKVGLLLFSDEVELYLRPRKSVRHTLRLIRELLFFKPKHKGTNLTKALSFLGKVQKRHAVCFLISDFLVPPPTHEAAVVAKKHDLIAIRVQDSYESRLPALGLLQLEDLETGQRLCVDTSYAHTQEKFSQEAQEREIELKRFFEHLGAGWIPLSCDGPYLDHLYKYFKWREHRR